MSLPTRPRPRSSTAPSGVWRGRITRLVDGRPVVEVPRLTPGYEYGADAGLDVLAGVYGHLTSAVAVGDHGTHAHAESAPLAAGDRVLVAFVEGRPDDPVVLGRLR